MDLALQRQTAIVVGGARGVGLAIAESFAKEHANLALIDLEGTIGDTAAELAQRHGIKTTSFVADVTDYNTVQQAARHIQIKLNRIDHIVFAVGLGSGKFGFPFWNLEPADWPRILNVNVVGAVNVAHAFYQQLIDAEAGTLTFLASVAGQIGSQTDPPYSAAKAALINFSQCAAKDLAPYGVRVNTVNPGMVQTVLNRAVWESWYNQQPEDKRKSYEDWAAEKIRNVVPLNRWQEPEDIANMVVFLASPAAKNITGQTINVDGGFVMHW